MKRVKTKLVRFKLQVKLILSRLKTTKLKSLRE